MGAGKILGGLQEQRKKIEGAKYWEDFRSKRRKFGLEQRKKMGGAKILEGP